MEEQKYSFDSPRLCQEGRLPLLTPPPPANPPPLWIIIISTENYVEETTVYVCTYNTAICQLSTTSLAEQMSYFLSIVLAGAASELQKHTIHNTSTYAFVTPAEWLRYPKWGSRTTVWEPLV